MDTEVKELLVKASRLVEEANVSEDLRGVAFAKTLDILHQGAGFSPTSRRQGDASVEPQPDQGEDGTLLSTLANSLELPLEQIKDVFYADGERIELIISPQQLDKSTAGAMKEIALLITVARQCSGLEEWTPVSEVREVCDDFRKVDSSNFAKTITSMQSLRPRGKGQQRELKVRRPALEEAKDLIKRLSLGGES